MDFSWVENQDHLEKKVNGGVDASEKGKMASSWKRVSFQAVGLFSWRKVSETVVMLSPWISEQWRTEVCKPTESQIELPNPTTLNGLIQCLTCVWSRILQSVYCHQVSEAQTQAQASHSCMHPTLCFNQSNQWFFKVMNEVNIIYYFFSLIQRNRHSSD